MKRPSTGRTDVKIKLVKQVICGYHQLTVHMIANQLNMKKDSVCKIITEDLGMQKVCAKTVPRLLNDHQKEHHMQMFQDIIEHLQTKLHLLCRVITGDKTWIFKYNLKTKCQRNQWKSSVLPRKAKQSQKSKSCWSRSVMWGGSPTVSSY